MLILFRKELSKKLKSKVEELRSSVIYSLWDVYTDVKLIHMDTLNKMYNSSWFKIKGDLLIKLSIILDKVAILVEGKRR